MNISQQISSITCLVQMTLTTTSTCIPHMHLHMGTPKESFCSCRRRRHRSQSSRGMLTYSGLPERKERRGWRGGRHPLKHFISIIQSSAAARGKAGQGRDGGDISRSTFQFMVPARSLPPSPLRALNEEDKHHKRAEERT